MPIRQNDRQAWILIDGGKEKTLATVRKAVRRGGWAARKIMCKTVGGDSHFLASNNVT